MQQTHKLPCFLFEDCLSLLRGLVCLAWIGVTAGVAVEVWIRVFSAFEWPRLGGFSTTYNAILLEFTLNTVVLTILLVQRDWYERIPRDAAHRLRWLLVAVLVWGGLHLFGAFHVTGSMQGPLMLLLPVLMAWALIALPGRAGVWFAAYLLAGHLAVVLLEAGGKIHPRGLLADAFALTQSITGLGLASMVVGILAGMALGLLIRRWMYPGPDDLPPSLRIDLATGLFRRPFLEQRLAPELGRTRRQGGELGLLLLTAERQEGGTPSLGELRQLAHDLMGKLRLDSDTPARYGPTEIAVLLPAAGGATGVEQILQRLQNELARQAPTLRVCAAAVVTRGHGVDGSSLMLRAEAALQQARDGQQFVVERIGERGA